MWFKFSELSGSKLEEAAAHYEQHGFFLVEGVTSAVTVHFRPLIAQALNLAESDLSAMLDPNAAPIILPVEIRKRLSRVETTPELAETLFGSLRAMFVRLLGPFVHASSTFHAQFKSGPAPAVDHGGYKSDYMEVQGAYLLHQDFAGAKIPTSPSGITLWVPQNSSPDWNLRIYPGSHRKGLLCNTWMQLDHPNLSALGTPIDIEARHGTMAVFHSLLLHGSSNQGLRRRVSCDIRFFPLCGFLPTAVHTLSDRAIELLRGAHQYTDEISRAPLLEQLAFTGKDALVPDVDENSILNWSNHLHHRLRGEKSEALAYLTRWVNRKSAIDPPLAFTSKFHDFPLDEGTMARAKSLPSDAI